MSEMLTLSHFLGFLFAAPALDRSGQTPPEHHRHKAIQALRLSPHLLRDVGMEDYEDARDDPRWVRRPDLER